MNLYGAVMHIKSEFNSLQLAHLTLKLSWSNRNGIRFDQKHKEIGLVIWNN